MDHLKKGEVKSVIYCRLLKRLKLTNVYSLGTSMYVSPLFYIALLYADTQQYGD
jgi:hypothetical protein